jgi:hypothetical protein
VVALLFHVLLSLAVVQAPPGRVVGTVTDAESGTPLPGATIALSDLSQGTTADARGRYVLTDVPPGPQHIVVRFLGYAPRVLHALVPREGELAINVALRATPLRLQTIEVRPSIAIRGLEQESVAYPDRSLSMAAVRTDPVLAEPDALEALGGGEVVVSPESPTGLHIRGGASDQTGFVLDGVPVLSPYHAAGLFGAWNPDALTGVTLSTSGPSSVGWPAALGGTVAAETREPGPRVDVQGALSTSQARATVAGPVGKTGVGFLLSLRSGFPSGIGGDPDPSLLRGETADRLATVQLPALGGELRLLGYDNDNEVSTAAVANTEDNGGALVRNRFAWHGRSLGSDWQRGTDRARLRVTLWHAGADADVDWLARSGTLAMASARQDLGALVSLERRARVLRTLLGLRIERSRATYATMPSDAASSTYALRSEATVASAFVRGTLSLGRRLELDLGATATAAGGVAPRLDPGVQVRWLATHGLTLFGGYDRRRQLSQSLRNPESIVANVFPAGLPIGSSAASVPDARSELGVIGAELRPSPGIRLAGQAYLRRSQGLLLTAPAAADPFASDSFTIGTGRASGVAFEVSMASARYALTGSYAYQQISLNDGVSAYVPEYGVRHLVDGGVVVFPSPTLALRLGGSLGAGRHATTIPGSIEWESCNLLDKGCELAGSPHYDGTRLGATSLPAYFRVDLGVRKHWHLTLAGRDAVVGLYGTVTNVFGRTNILTYTDPSSGSSTPVEMRPLSPLVIGLDWRF